MSRSRPIVAALAGLAAGVAGCNTVSAGASPGTAAARPGALHPHDAALFLAAGSLVILAVVIASVGRRAIAHHRFEQGMRKTARPAVIGGMTVGFVPGTGIALVAGIRRPQTYVSSDLMAALTGEEVAAVLAHEHHHVLRRAPLRLIVIAGIDGLAGGIAPIARWLARLRAGIEIAADAHALAAGSSRRALVRAILKLGAGAPAGTIATFDSAADIRLRALLADEPATSGRWRDDLFLAVALAVVSAVACSALML